MRRKPNNYGTIKKLSGNRLRPFVACKPGKLNREKCFYDQEVIGYYETWEEANDALSTWNRTRGSKTNYSFRELYTDWSAKMFPKLTKSTADCYRSAWNHLEPIHERKVKDIRSGHIQDIIDGLSQTLSHSSLHKIKVLFGLLESYAMQFDIIEKNYAEFVELPPAVQKEKEIFSDEQVDIIKKAAENDFMWSRVIMILIDTGWRISELLDLKCEDYNPAALTMIGGKKTENGKNRIVPVQLHIKPYLDEHFLHNGPRLICKKTENGWERITPDYFRKFCFKPTLDALGIHQSDGSDFTPHAARHTFASRAKKAGMDPLVLKKIIGHSPKADVTEKVYIHIDEDQLRDGMDLLDKIG
jgi:integrase